MYDQRPAWSLRSYQVWAFWAVDGDIYKASSSLIGAVPTRPRKGFDRTWSLISPSSPKRTSWTRERETSKSETRQVFELTQRCESSRRTDRSDSGSVRASWWRSVIRLPARRIRRERRVGPRRRREGRLEVWWYKLRVRELRVSTRKGEMSSKIEPRIANGVQVIRMGKMCMCLAYHRSLNIDL